MAEDIFIDAESQNVSNEKNGYEDIVLSQISFCVKCLSREMTGGVNVIHYTKYGEKREYKEDLREVAINSIWTLKTLLIPYIKKNADVIIKIEEEIDKYLERVGESEEIVKGYGKKKLKDIGFIPPEHPAWKKFIEFKLNKYKEIFALLVNFYNKNKEEIRKLSEE